MMLYLALRHKFDLEAALLANANAGGGLDFIPLTRFGASLKFVV
jgi:hypothetical protein